MNDVFEIMLMDACEHLISGSCSESEIYGKFRYYLQELDGHKNYDKYKKIIYDYMRKEELRNA